MEDIILDKAPWLLEKFKSLPLWAKIAIITLILAGLTGLLWWTKIKPSQVPRAIKSLQKQAINQWNRIKPKDRNNTNWGGGHLDLVGQEGVNSGDDSGFRTSPDIKYPGKHVEEQVIDWAAKQIEDFRKAHGNAPLESLTLDLYTFKAPCSGQHNNCSLNLQPGGAWEQRLKQAAGIQNDKDVHITVYTSNGLPGNPIEIWP